MNVHYLQHVPFEDLGSIEPYLLSRQHTVTSSLLYANPALPDADSVDWLIVLGSPMSVHDEALHSWLAAEKRFIAEFMAQDKPVLGICLGAQLIAQLLGATVRPNARAEIGWFPVQRTAGVGKSPLAAVFPEFTEAFHWHGETFDIPEHTIHLARSVACPNQGFIYNEKVLALQFHLETTPQSAQALIENCGEDITPGPHVQKTASMLADPERFVVINALMQRVLQSMENMV